MKFDLQDLESTHTLTLDKVSGELLLEVITIDLPENELKYVKHTMDSCNIKKFTITTKELKKIYLYDKESKGLKEMTAHEQTN
jgi:hypothetical protein